MPPMWAQAARTSEMGSEDPKPETVVAMPLRQRLRSGLGSKAFWRRRVRNVPQVKPGSILLARHGKSALSRTVWLSAEGYRQWWGQYDTVGLDATRQPPARFLAFAEQADVIYCSTLLRSQETAAQAASGRPVQSDVVFIEAPLPPPNMPNWFRLMPRIWGAVARVNWMLGGHGDGETARDARLRARQAAERLLAEVKNDQVVMLVAHGWFNRMIGQELKKLGWACTDDGGFKHWAVRLFEPRAAGVEDMSPPQPGGS